MTTARSDALYGTRRVDDAKPLLRGWLHVVWFVASLVFGTLLLADAHGARRSAAVLIYATSVSALFGTSALYHRGHWNTAWNRRLQRLDHAMIFVLIAGTATPAFLVAAPGANGLVAVTVMWILTILSSNGACVRCAGSRPWPGFGYSPAGMRSCRTCAGATTRSPSTSPPDVDSLLPSSTWPEPSDNQSGPTAR
jgi:predicted membrane channel-forming protein YqfA (hemolysin III family)